MAKSAVTNDREEDPATQEAFSRLIQLLYEKDVMNYQGSKRYTNGELKPDDSEGAKARRNVFARITEPLLDD